MKEILSLALSAVGSALELLAFRNWWTSWHAIPQSEIDEEADHLILEHGDRAVEFAEGFVERAQKLKKKGDNRKRYGQVLKAVRMKSGS